MSRNGAVPDGWRRVRLSQVAAINKEVVPASTPSDAEIRYIDIASIRRTGHIDDPVELIFAEAPSRARRRVRAGDILISTVRPYLRAFARVREAPPNLVASTGFAVVTPGGEVDGDLLYQLVLSAPFVEHLVPRMTGTNYPAVSADSVAAFEFMLPPPREQHVIAQILSAIDDAIERSELVIERAQAAKQALAHELVTRGLPGRHARFKQTAVGEIPEDWRIAELRDLVEAISYGTSAKCHLEAIGLPVLRIPNVGQGQIDVSDLKYAKLSAAEIDRLRLKHGDILVIRTNGNPQVCGRFAMFRDLSGCWLYASYLLRLRPSGARIVPEYLEAALSSRSGREQLRGSIRTSAGNYNLSAGGLAKLLLPLPTLDEQEKMVALWSAVDAKLQSEQEFVKRRREVKRQLASALLTGELRVGQR